MHGTIFLANASIDNQKNRNMIDVFISWIYHKYAYTYTFDVRLRIIETQEYIWMVCMAYKRQGTCTDTIECWPTPYRQYLPCLSWCQANQKIQEMRPYNIDQPGVSDLLHQSDTNDLPIPGPQLKQPKLYQSQQVDHPNACPCPCPSESSGGINLFLRCMKNFKAKWGATKTTLLNLINLLLSIESCFFIGF